MRLYQAQNVSKSWVKLIFLAIWGLEYALQNCFPCNGYEISNTTFAVQNVEKGPVYNIFQDEENRPRTEGVMNFQSWLLLANSRHFKLSETVGLGCIIFLQGLLVAVSVE
ncbi:hypothetical protein DFH27DRAFT_346752 [Peziza echinospora]|nr:hypothetical protein DFH27DRAFT_346752 [Peziza echinospora]